MPFVIEYSGIPTITPTEEFFLTCLLNVYSAPSSLTTRRLRARLFVDAVEKPIKKATFSTSSGQDSNLSIELANIDDRSAFTRTASILLYTEEYLAGAWTEIKRYCDGAILATSNYSLANNGNNPADTFSVTVQSVLQQLLNLTPEQYVVLHDPAKTDVDVESLEVVPDEDGESEDPTVTPVADLNLGDVFQFLADTYELDGYKTNINWEPWVLPRVDFPPGVPYWNTVAGIIGNHKPHVSIKDNYLVIADGTLTDYVSARQMTLSNFGTFALNKQIERFKGCKLSKQLKDQGYDYWLFNVEHEQKWFEDVVGQYPYTTVERWEQVFYRLSRPNTPVDKRTLKEYVFTYSGAGVLEAASGEVLGWGGHGQMTRRDRRVFGRQKSPASWVTFSNGLPAPIANFTVSFGAEEIYSSASDASFSEAVVLTQTERETFLYRAHPFEADSVYLKEYDHWQKGLIVKDTENQQLGDDFEQTLPKAQESGNLQEGQASYWGTTDYKGESITVRKDRTVSVRPKGTNATVGSGPGVQPSVDPPRVGDIGIPVIKTRTEPIYIRTNGDPTATLWRDVNGGEEPDVSLFPLCHRLNKSQDFPGGVSGDLPTYDETMDIGLVTDPRVDGRDAVSVGIFEVIGYTDTLDNISNGGFKTSIQAKQIG